jgi:predicted alpha/beta superfamily hydrolase
MEWQVDETVTELIENGEIEPLIVVGIDNAGRSGRANEYLPYPDEFLSPALPDPEGRKYPVFLTSEVMPFVDKAYRTKTGRENTAIGGSSYGALIALFSYLQRSDKFGRLLLESPSLYVAKARILREVEEHRVLPLRIYLGVGTNEGGQENCAPGDLSNEAVQDVSKLKKIFLDHGLRDRDLKVVIEDCAVHNEAAWAGRMEEALKFLFPRK